MGRRRLRDHLRGLPDARWARGRPLWAAPHVRRGAGPLRAGLAGRGCRSQPGDARRRPRGPGTGGRADGGVLAGDHHRLLPPRPQAPPRDRHLGGDERARWIGRRAARRDPHRSAELALGTFDQPPDRACGRAHRLRRRERAPPGEGRRELRPRRRADADDRPDGPRLRRGGSGPAGLGHVRRTRPDRARRDPARAVRGDRDARGLGAADSLQGTHQAAADSQQHRPAVQRVAVPDVVRQLPLPAAGARTLPAAHRPDLPADDAHDHARRLARGAAREPLRRAAGARQWADHADRRDAAARENRIQRQRDRVRDDSRPADRGGHRDVDRPLHDRRHAGRQGGSGGARVGTGQHLPPGRRRSRAGGSDHAGHPALHAPDRLGGAGRAGPDPRLPARLPDRRRPRRPRRRSSPSRRCPAPRAR